MISSLYSLDESYLLKTTQKYNYYTFGPHFYLKNGISRLIIGHNW